MLSKIKEPEDISDTLIEWKTLDQRKRQYIRSKRLYFIKQKISGGILIASSIISTTLLDGDATILLITLPLGLYLIFTKDHAMMF